MGRRMVWLLAVSLLILSAAGAQATTVTGHVSECPNVVPGYPLQLWIVSGGSVSGPLTPSVQGDGSWTYVVNSQSTFLVVARTLPGAPTIPVEQKYFGDCCWQSLSDLAGPSTPELSVPLVQYAPRVAPGSKETPYVDPGPPNP